MVGSRKTKPIVCSGYGHYSSLTSNSQLMCLSQSNNKKGRYDISTTHIPFRETIRSNCQEDNKEITLTSQEAVLVEAHALWDRGSFPTLVKISQ